MASTPYSELLRASRALLGISLRDVARAIGVSHVYVADVERGLRAPLTSDYDDALLTVLTCITRADLERARALSRPLRLDVAAMPQHYQDLSIALARRVEGQDLSDEAVGRLMAILEEERK